MFNSVMCRYNEIALKGGNRRYFEALFIEGIRHALKELGSIKIIQERGRVVLHISNFKVLTQDELSIIQARLPKVFGLASFSPGIIVDSTLPEIEKCVLATFPDVYERFNSACRDGDTIRYRMRARRSDKNFPLTSNALEIHFAEQLLAKYQNMTVDLNHADLTVGVEVRDDWSFIFYDHTPGPGGLPSGCNGPALALLSGGIDSPVACYLTMKRGCPLNFLTFHSYPYTNAESISKVGRIIQILNQYQRPGKFLACNLVPVQKAVRDNCTEKFRTILYRRMMIRIAEAVAHSLGAQALVSGDAVGQVASQTIRNMDTIGKATDMLILRPLVGMDKLETIRIAKSINTLYVSEENCPDSCTVFAPKSPSTGAKLKRIIDEEALLDVPGLLQESLDNIKLIDVKTGEESVYALI